MTVDDYDGEMMVKCLTYRSLGQMKSWLVSPGDLTKGKGAQGAPAFMPLPERTNPD